MRTPFNPRVYITSLSDYNSGILHGAWMDFTEDIHEQVEKLLKASPSAKLEGSIAEEWAIHDSEGFPKGLVQEHSDLDGLAYWAEFIEETDDDDLIQAALDCVGSTDLDDVKDLVENNQAGQIDRSGLASWAQEQCEDCDEGSLKKLPSFIRYHIDWEGVGRDMLHDYSYSEVNGTTYLFSN